MIVWRATERPMIDIVLEIIQNSDRYQNLIKSTLTATINNLFKFKTTIYLFTDEIQRLLSNRLILISHFHDKIHDKITVLHEKK